MEQARVNEALEKDKAGTVREIGPEEQPALPHLLGRALMKIKQAMEAEMGVSVLTSRIMLILANQDGATQNYLTSCMGVDASMITRTVKEMENELGWVHRERDPEDNRLMRVFLTEEGKHQASKLPRRAKELEKRLTRNLSQNELEQLRHYLQVLEDTARLEYENHRRDLAHNN